VTTYDELCSQLRAQPRKWLVTGAAGFIGSHLVENLLKLDQVVVGLDNFATGRACNLSDVEAIVGASAWQNFEFVEGDIRSETDAARACAGVDHVLHQAALGSVPRSIKDPLSSHAANVDGFLKLSLAARDAGAKSMVFASSSSVYGDHPELPKREMNIGQPLSPYAATKYIDEVYAGVLHRCYDMRIAGLRYFNVMGERQDPDGAYAAVIPRWVATFLRGEVPQIFGDGETSRDFCPIDNVVQANLLAADRQQAAGEIFNIALGGRTSLNELFFAIRDRLSSLGVDCMQVEPAYQDFRPGDVRHSLADTSKAVELLGYDAAVDFASGLARTVTWFREQAQADLGVA